jgi:hypothetical protein
MPREKKLKSEPKQKRQAARTPKSSTTSRGVRKAEQTESWGSPMKAVVSSRSSGSSSRKQAASRQAARGTEKSRSLSASRSRQGSVRKGASSRSRKQSR